MSHRLIDQELVPGAMACVKKYAQVRDTDSVLIIFDNPRIADALIFAVRQVSKAQVDAMYLGQATRPERTLTHTLKEALARATVVFTAFEAFSEEDNFRGEILAFARGRKRIYHMPGATEEMFTGEGALGLTDEEIDSMVELTKELAVMLSLASVVNIRSGIFPKTDLTINIGDTENTAIVSTGFVPEGAWGNVPSGEAFIIPTGQLPSGKLVVDRAISGVPAGFEAIDLDVVNGRIQVRRNGRELQNLLKAAAAEAKGTQRSDENVTRICEFGIGTNPKAAADTTLEVEKILGTIHVAVGDNTIFGGTVWAPDHIDMVISRPTVTIDGKDEILSDGSLNRDTVRSYPLISYIPFLGQLSGAEAAQTVSVFHDRVRTEGDRLYRKWRDHRGTEYVTPVGDSETAQLAKKVHDLLTQQAKPLSVAAVAAGAESSGIRRDVTQAVIRVLARFGAASLGHERSKELKVV